MQIILNSGGYDSTVLLHLSKLSGKKFISLFFDYGQYSLVAEDKLSRQNAELLGAEEHIRLKLPLYWGIPTIDKLNAYIPYRNLIFLSYALSIAEAKGADEIVFGAIKCPIGEAFKDADNGFINWFDSECLMSNIKLVTPLINLFKEEVFRFGTNLGVNIHDTWSCDSPVMECGYKFIRCGKCNDCTQLKSAIAEGVINPLDFHS